MKKLVLLCGVIICLGAAVYAIPQAFFAEGKDADDAMELYSSTEKIQYLAPCIQSYNDVKKAYYNCICGKNDKKAIAIIKQSGDILAKHQDWLSKGPINVKYENRTKIVNPAAYKIIIDAVSPCLNK